MGNKKPKLEPGYFFVFFLASARRSVFFRRLARFLALSLPLLFPISFKTHSLAPPRHVVVSTKTRKQFVVCGRHIGRNRGRRLLCCCVRCDTGAGASCT